METTLEEWERCKASPAYFYHNYFIGVDGNRPTRTMSDASFDRLCGVTHVEFPELVPPQSLLRGLYCHMWGELANIRATRGKPYKVHAVDNAKECKMTITFPDCWFYVSHSKGPVKFEASGLSFADCCKVVGYIPLPKF